MADIISDIGCRVEIWIIVFWRGQLAIPSSLSWSALQWYHRGTSEHSLEDGAVGSIAWGHSVVAGSSILHEAIVVEMARRSRLHCVAQQRYLYDATSMRNPGRFHTIAQRPPSVEPSVMSARTTISSSLSLRRPEGHTTRFRIENAAYCTG